MRAAPEYIRKMVKGYDPLLDLEWDGREARWYVVVEGVRQFTLDHADGTPVRNLDGHGTETLETLRRCDLKWQGREPLKRRLRAIRPAAAQVRERLAAESLADSRAEARKVAKFFKSGVTPMVGGALGSMKAGAA